MISHIFFSCLNLKSFFFLKSWLSLAFLRLYWIAKCIFLKLGAHFGSWELIFGMFDINFGVLTCCLHGANVPLLACCRVSFHYCFVLLWCWMLLNDVVSLSVLSSDYFVILTKLRQWKCCNDLWICCLNIIVLLLVSWLVTHFIYE